MIKATRIFFNILVVSALGFVTCSCQDDVDQRFPFFELVVDANYSFNEERWVIATDADGRVLDASAYTTGKTVQLQSTKVVTSPFTITLLSHCNDCSVRHFNFTSYCEITPDSKWSLAWPGAGKALPTENAGKVPVEVSNLPSPIRLNPQGDNYLITSF
jgi:hypothetical protein